MSGHYYRADHVGRRQMPFFKHPGKYGLFIWHKDDAGTLRPFCPDDMVASADSVEALRVERRVFKGPSRGYVAVLALAVRIPEFDVEGA